MLAIAGFIFVSAKAQVGQTVQVTNHTNCQIHFKLRGDVNTVCGERYTGTIGSVGANSNIAVTAYGLYCGTCTSPDPTTLSAGDDVVGAEIWDGDPNICGGATMVTYIGDYLSCAPGASGTTSASFTPLSVLTCTSLGCSNVVGTWGTNGVDPTLDFN